MVESYYYLLSFLPSLGQLDDAPDMNTTQFLEQIAESEGPVELVEMILLGDDLMQRQAVLAGEVTETEPVVLTDAQLRDDQPLPEYLVSEGEYSGQVAADSVWDAYFHHAAAVAGRAEGKFLAAWIGFEVALRNAMAEARAKALSLEVGKYLVAEELADGSVDCTAVLNEWSVAADPLAGMKVIDRARWDWLLRNDEWFSFGADELAAYAAKLMLIQRWNRITTNNK